MSNMVHAYFQLGIYEIGTLASIIIALLGYLLLIINSTVRLFKYKWCGLLLIEKASMVVAIMITPLADKGFFIIRSLIIHGTNA